MCKGKWERWLGLTSLFTATLSGQVGLRKEYTVNLGTNSLKLSVPGDLLETLYPHRKEYSKQKYYTIKIQSHFKITPDKELFFLIFLNQNT